MKGLRGKKRQLLESVKEEEIETEDKTKKDVIMIMLTSKVSYHTVTACVETGGGPVESHG